jgi:hypothetical protein
MRYLFGFICVCALGVMPLVGCFRDLCIFDCDPCAGVVCPPDDNECTREYCSGGSCTSEPVTNGRSCTFDGLSGVCVSGVCGENVCEDVLCEDDGNDCTEGVCNFVTGTCDFTPVVCDDDSPCTEDACNPAAGCTFTPVDDGTWCIARGGELWLMGVCEARACVGPCEPWVSGKTYPYPCPIEDYEDLVCCSGREYCQPLCGY